MQNVTNNMASAVVSSAINGTPLNEDTLSTALSSALITAGMAQTANNIGAATQNGTLNAYTQALAHALAGCVGGAATTGNSGGCSAGAVGAVVGELTATYALSQNMSDAAIVNFAKTMSAVAGAMVGGPDSAAAVNVAAQMGANAALNNLMAHVSRPLDSVIGVGADHRATVVGRDTPEQFPADVRQVLGEPVKLPDGKYGYVLEDLKSSDGVLYPVANGFPNLTGNNSSPAATMNALSNGTATVYRVDPDNFSLENALLRNYANAIKSGATVPYPSNASTVACYLDFCNNFTNSNTMADKRLQQGGILPPNTGTTNVPGGIYDRDTSPWDALLNTATDKLNKTFGK
jgi:hypothetical protein